MGRKYFNLLYDKICHHLNLWAAYKNAARGKHSHPPSTVPPFSLLTVHCLLSTVH
jgi:hypothetical protein